jgi:hypothetical protein
MLACCGRPAAAAFGDRFPYIVPRYARETIAEIRSLGVVLATAIIGQSGSCDTAFLYSDIMPRKRRCTRIV